MSATTTVFSDSVANWFTPSAAVVAIGFALWLWYRVSQIKVRGGATSTASNGREYLLEEEQRGESEIEEKVADLQVAITEGATSFLLTEYKYVSLFMGVFSIFVFVLLSSQDGFQTKWKKDATGTLRAPAVYNGLFSTIAFVIGAATSIVSGYLGDRKSVV